MGILDFRNKTGSDVSVTTFRAGIPIYKTGNESWGKGNEGQPFCRICQGSSSSVNQLISPCSCKGTLGYVHITCLEKWLNSSSRISCELCHYKYDIQQTRRYTLWESLRLWLRHPVNWRHLQADFIILTLLSIITTVLIIICTLSLDSFVIEGKKYGVSENWTKGVLDIFLTLVVTGYIGAMAFLIKQQFTPWYYWWTNTLNIQLRMNWNLSCLESRKKLFDELVPQQLESTDNIVNDEPDLCSRETLKKIFFENMMTMKPTPGLLKPRNLEIFRKFQTAGNQKQTEVAAVSDSADAKSEWDAAKAFHAIPGPKPLPIPYLGNVFRFMIAEYNKTDLVDSFVKLHEVYGPLVRLSGMGKEEQLILGDPAHVEKMFRNESNWPNRKGLDCLKYYRTVLRKDFYNDVEGLVTSQGEQWQQFRNATNQTMMQPKNVKMYLGDATGVIEDFIERIRYIRQPNEEMPDDFLSELNKLSLEFFGVVTLDTRLGCLSKDLSPDSDAMKMINSVKSAMSLMHKLEFVLPFWKYFPSSTWKKFVKDMDQIFEMTVKYTTAKWEMIKKQDGKEDKLNKSILETLLLRTKNPKIPIVMASDTLFAGVDTTSNSVGTILYYLAINPEKQEKLYSDLRRLLPEKSSKITHDVLNELKYIRAVIKESMRLTPTAPMNQRVAPKDLVFGEYQIPKGTVLIANHYYMCRSEKHFKDALKFIPERWLRSDSNSEISEKKTNPFVFLPFGFGHRSCIGQRFADLEMEMVISKIVRNFKIGYDHEPMTWRTRLICSPDKPLKFRMSERPE